MNNINLVRNRKQELKARNLLYMKVQFVSMVVLILFMGVVLALYGFRVYASNQLKSVQEGIENEEKAIGTYKVIEAKYRILVNKLELIEAYVEENESIINWLQDIYASLPEGIVIQGVELNNLDAHLGLTLKFATMNEIVAYLDLLKKEVELGNSYFSASIESISRVESGEYQASIVYSR